MVAEKAEKAEKTAPRGRAKPTTATHVVVTQVRSAIGSKPKHRGTLRALGLRRIGHHSVLPDRPEIRGMIARVPHLVSVAPADAPPGGGTAGGSAGDQDQGEGATR
jgi:large subunit ribosomal protein L30